jgi:hypothetical protein
VSQYAKLHVAGWTWAVSTRVYLESYISLRRSPGISGYTLVYVCVYIYIYSVSTQLYFTDKNHPHVSASV